VLSLTKVTTMIAIFDAHSAGCGISVVQFCCFTRGRYVIDLTYVVIGRPQI
jgi:hypothetical protein